ncbi:penicillin-binding protein activator [Reyranella soli]|uniref:Penicillin-binding protein activator n=1 Tax=Reyranella soli TaxID=1230389 RepID=A0A512NS63_9HYPH|nr:penicillin-binding protein activator [Reyranella soli]GEP61790.1 penicillin-binding protein activator [Reyranella soli]
MRQSLFALATMAFLLAACGEQSKTSTPAPLSTTVTASVGSPVTASGKYRIALLLPLSGRAAPIGQSLQQAAEMALFDTGAKELALAAYDSGETADTAVEAYRKARTDGAALVLGPLFGTSATALAPLVSQGGANVISFSNDEQAAQRGVWIMGIAAPPQVRRVVDYAVDSGVKRFAAFAPQTSYGQQMVQTMESQVTMRGGKVAAVELFDANSADLNTPARRLAEASRGEDKLAVLVPVAPPRLSAALAALAAAGIENKSVQLIGTGVWDVPNIGQEVMLRGAWYAAPDPAKRADFERRFLTTYGRPPHRLATLAYDGVSLAGHLARLKQGGDFSEAAITNPNGWSGIDGIFRFLPNGRSERALAVIAVQAGPGAVVSPAPTNFARPVN